MYTPIHDKTIPPAELGSRFMVWVSTYFDAVPDQATMTEAKLATRSNNYLSITDPTRKATILRFTEEELPAVADFTVMERTPDVTWGVLPEIYWENTHRALIDTQGVWPDMKALLMWCDMSTPDIVWAMKTVTDRTLGAQASGVPTRDVKVVKVEGGNHFVSLSVCSCGVAGRSDINVCRLQGTLGRT